MNAFDTPNTKAMANFLEREAGRVTGLSIEPDGVFIYTDSSVWCDDAGAGTFREDSETAAIRRFYERVQPVEVDFGEPGEIGPCPACGCDATPLILGSLGDATWIRCRACGSLYEA